MYPPVVILIATAGQKTLLKRTLSSLKKCRFGENYNGLYVVENGSKYEAEAVVADFTEDLNAKYFFLGRGNKSAALNFALVHIPDDTLIWFTDDDIRVDPNILNLYCQASNGVTSGCFYGGPTLVDYEESPPDWLIESLPFSAKGWQPNGNKDYLRTPRFLGFNWAAFAKDLRNAGGFNENLGPGTVPRRTGQEREMQERLLEQGIKAVFVEKALVWHYVPKNKSTLPWLLKRRYANGIGKGVRLVERFGRQKPPRRLFEKFVISLFRFLISLLTFSRKKWVRALSGVYSAMGGFRGYFIQVFSRND